MRLRADLLPSPVPACLWPQAGAPVRYASWGEPPPASASSAYEAEEPFIMATATTTLRVSLPSPRGGLRHHMPSPVSPRLKPHKLKLPDVRHDPFQAVIRAARVSGDPTAPSRPFEMRGCEVSWLMLFAVYPVPFRCTAPASCWRPCRCRACSRTARSSST